MIIGSRRMLITTKFKPDNTKGTLLPKLMSGEVGENLECTNQLCQQMLKFGL